MRVSSMPRSLANLTDYGGYSRQPVQVETYPVQTPLTAQLIDRIWSIYHIIGLSLDRLAVCVFVKLMGNTSNPEYPSKVPTFFREDILIILGPMPLMSHAIFFGTVPRS